MNGEMRARLKTAGLAWEVGGKGRAEVSLGIQGYDPVLLLSVGRGWRRRVGGVAAEREREERGGQQ